MTGQLIESEFIERKNVKDILKNVLSYPLNIVVAPIGYGKTTAVKKYVQDIKIRSVWISMSELGKDNDFFWQELIKSIAQFNQTLTEELQSLGFPSDNIRIAKALNIIKKRSAKEEIIIVFDDYYLIENNEKNELLLNLIQLKIPYLHIIILSRFMPDIPVAGLIVSGLCHLLDHDVLAFSIDETEKYLSLYGCHVNKKQLEEIQDYTCGWITAICLTKNYLVNGEADAFSKFYHDSELLLKSVITHIYEPEITEFLYKICFLESFTMDQACFILEEKKVIDYIKRLYRDSFFILRNHEGAYKLNKIVRNLLCSGREPNKNDIDYQKLYARAGLWYINEKKYIEGLSCLFKAQHLEDILMVMDKKETTLDIIQSALIINDNLLEMILSMQDQIKYQYPMAMIKLIYIYCLVRDKEKGAEMFNLLANYYNVYNHATYSNKRILGEIEFHCSITVFNDIQKVFDHFDKSYELLKGQSYISDKHDGLIFSSPHLSYMYYREKGHYKDIIEILSSRYESYLCLIGSNYVSFQYLVFAEYYLETGDLEQAQLNVLKAVHLAQKDRFVYLLVCAKFTLTRLYLAQGNISGVNECLSYFAVISQNDDNLYIRTTVDIARAYIYSCMDQIDEIPEWIKSRTNLNESFRHSMDVFSIVYGKYVLLSGDFIELDALINNFLAQFRVYNNQLGYIYTFIYSAAAKCTLYGIADGVVELNKALTIAEADNIVMPFAENAEYILPILKSELVNVNSTYLKRLTACCIEHLAIKRKIKRSKGFLSDREIEILQSLNDGLKIKEIAKKLFLSPNTVSTHMKNIYSKLDVNNKIAAIKKACEINII
ncbi:LuxR C-terminal-related transcriptional regulator [Dehalobacter sp. DCM]|uniref:helix-turn-helix transcriptional regulator n=1 Tax=Dehalobacter sp. DCM TaxID=2907827 RepID=UPI003081D724|nr:LuxR C-terminal-related transcriptional regulator [Dehalobacter sp. DCM]